MVESLTSEKLAENEKILDSLTADDWEWYCTNRRVLKYKSGGLIRGEEELVEVSRDELEDVIEEVEKPGGAYTTQIIGVIAIIFSIIQAVHPIVDKEVSPFLWILVLVPFGLFWVYVGRQMDRVKFIFQGTGSVIDDSDRWTIVGEDFGDPDPQEARKFVNKCLEK